MNNVLELVISCKNYNLVMSSLKYNHINFKGETKREARCLIKKMNSSTNFYKVNGQRLCEVALSNSDLSSLLIQLSSTNFHFLNQQPCPNLGHR